MIPDDFYGNFLKFSSNLHVGNIAGSPSAFIFCPPGDCGAAYDAGGWCSIAGTDESTETDIRAESPTINCSGQSGITLCFTYMENGDGTLDNTPSSDGITHMSYQMLQRTAEVVSESRRPCEIGGGQ